MHLFQHSNLRCLWELDESNAANRFQFAMFLSMSDDAADRRESVRHFDHLLSELQFVHDAMYNLALVYYSLGDYECSRYVL